MIGYKTFVVVWLYLPQDMEEEKTKAISDNTGNGGKGSFDVSSKDQVPIDNSTSEENSSEKEIRENLVMPLLFLLLIS